MQSSGSASLVYTYQKAHEISEAPILVGRKPADAIRVQVAQGAVRFSQEHRGKRVPVAQRAAGLEFKLLKRFPELRQASDDLAKHELDMFQQWKEEAEHRESTSPTPNPSYAHSEADFPLNQEATASSFVPGSMHDHSRFVLPPSPIGSLVANSPSESRKLLLQDGHSMHEWGRPRAFHSGASMAGTPSMLAEEYHRQNGAANGLSQSYSSAEMGNSRSASFKRYSNRLEPPQKPFVPVSASQARRQFTKTAGHVERKPEIQVYNERLAAGRTDRAKRLHGSFRPSNATEAKNRLSNKSTLLGKSDAASLKRAEAEAWEKLGTRGRTKLLKAGIVQFDGAQPARSRIAARSSRQWHFTNGERPSTSMM